MTAPFARPAPALIETERLILEPLRVDHADEMAPALDDVDLHTFIGGRPATRDELRTRYAAQVVGHSPDGRQGWLNWIVRHRHTDAPVGTVQATLTREGDGTVAELAWTIGVVHQRRGYAQEAATAMAGWLRQQGADRSRILVPGSCSDRSGWPSAPSTAGGRIRLGCRGPCGGPVEGTHMTDPDLSDLRRRSANGDRDAVDQLIEVAAERGDLDELRRLADGGYTDAVDQLIELAGERGDLEELRRLADRGSRDAADQLVELATERADVAELRRLAERGNRDAADVLAELAEERDDDRG